ncbi:MAG: peptide transporter [Epsilonproteobacteria bacterium]|nr:peptide transporter [Campylobacterota bacterium]
MRLIWVYHFSGYEQFNYNDQLMINTNDGYYFAEGAKDLLKNKVVNPEGKNYFDQLHNANDLSPVTTATSQLTAFFAKILPFSFESILLYMPVVLSSLIVIPIILIARDLKNLEMGFIAALLASIAWSYYNRTMAGYYDTDMLNIVLPMVLLWSIIWAIDTNEDKYLLIAAFDILVYRWWYPQSYALEFAFFGMILAYTVIFDRKNIYNYKLMAIMLFAMMGTAGWIRLVLVLAAFTLLRQEKMQKYVYYLFGAAVVVFFATGGFNPIWLQLQGYVFRQSIAGEQEGLGLHFFTVMQTVREAGKIPFETFANRISGHTITFIISLAGYLYLLYRHRIILFSLPLVGLGFLAYFGGLRFTIYAVPVLAMGMAFLITELAGKLPTLRLQVLTMAALTLAVLYPNYKHIENYKVPTVFTQNEVKVLEKLGQIANSEDYVVSWWDYGYPIRYYADVKTLVDGGKHSGAVNFPVSFMLTKPQEVAAKMARLDVEYTEKTFKFVEEHKEEIKDKNFTVFSNIEQMTTDYGFRDTNDFLRSLSDDIKLPQKTRDIYFYLPYRMLNIYPTIALFSDINLMNGVQKPRPLFFVTHRFNNQGSVVLLGNGVVLNKQNMSVKIGNKTLSLRRFVKTTYDKQMKLHLQEQLINFASNITLIYMASYNTFLLVDEKTYNSSYIQMMVLDKYDENLFEKLIDTPQAKVFRLKI